MDDFLRLVGDRRGRDRPGDKQRRSQLARRRLAARDRADLRREGC